MPRTEIHAEIEVKAAPKRVYDVLSDPLNVKKWLPNVTRVTVANKKAGVGAKRTVELRVGNTEMTSHQRVVVADPGKRFAWVHEADFVNREEFDLLADVGTVFELTEKRGGTRVIATAHFEPQGLTARLAAPLFENDVRRQMTSALENLKRLAERK